jgi:hypothetical protein
VQALEGKEAQQALRNKILELRGSAPADVNQQGIDEQWSICEEVIKNAADVIELQDPYKGMNGLILNVRQRYLWRMRHIKYAGYEEYKAGEGGLSKKEL